MNSHQIVAKWVTEILPGSFDGPDHTTVLRSVYNAAGVSRDMAVSDFEKCLDALGHRVQCVRAGLYRLNLPDGKSPGVRARAYRV